MSIHAVEAALWKISTDRETAEAYTRDKPGFLSGYRLSDSEVALLSKMDPVALGQYGANWLLVIGSYLAIFGRPAIHQYLAIINRKPQ